MTYEETAKSFRTSNIIIIVLNILSLILGLISLLGLFMTNQAIKQGNTDQYNLSARQIEIIKQALTPLSLTIIIVAIAINLAIVIFCFINLSRLNQETAVTPIPYYIGLVLSAISVINTTLAGNLSILSLGIQAAFIILYFYAIQKARALVKLL
ncbi:hypothetical protein [Streptococcus macacae]|uniref:Uncharacterized protein n=1 Tax=Streptococcus macacae NCTC 11558 TaxID=764298 RepID=G5JXH9_9STRE|nr:hypothetical protein [Streptococcus macacae]EHJ52584.1 hypothetical protein STRMA_1335 [Streptococcus macacae NCTC 11558]SUN79252.1 membrane protein [Streptococcus macacae NCTC 11558]